jgi:uncharacterized protein YjbI with pentapeptide repeats
VDQQQQSRWRLTKRQLLWAGSIAALAFLLIVSCGYLFGWKWTGLPKRTLWDWLQLLIIPAVLAGVGLWFNRQQREQELQTVDRRSQDEALQAYLDQMSEMLIPHSKDMPSLYKAHRGDRLRSVARARTLTVLPRLAGDRKARVVQFLYESGLISNARLVLVLKGADLSGAYQREASLSGADLSGTDLAAAYLFAADLSEANLIGTNLRGANLVGANLVGAHLGSAVLSGANLSGADLRGARLRMADLSGADLSGAFLNEAVLSSSNLVRASLFRANLKGAYLSAAYLGGANLREADLREADLMGAIEITNEKLKQEAKSLQGATMPNGQKYEDWLKNKGSGEE